MKELFSEHIEEEFITQIKQVQNYQQLVEVRNSFLSKYLNQKVETKEAIPVLTEIKPLKIKSFDKERYIWISLLVVSLIGIAGLIAKLKNSKSRK